MGAEEEDALQALAELANPTSQRNGRGLRPGSRDKWKAQQEEQGNEENQEEATAEPSEADDDVESGGGKPLRKARRKAMPNTPGEGYMTLTGMAYGDTSLLKDAGNCRNQTGYIGVRQRKWGMYAAEIRDGDKRRWLGSFPTGREAGLAYDAAAIAQKGTKAKTNFQYRDTITVPRPNAELEDSVRWDLLPKEIAEVLNVPGAAGKGGSKAARGNYAGGRGRGSDGGRGRGSTAAAAAPAAGRRLPAQAGGLGLSPPSSHGGGLDLDLDQPLPKRARMGSGGGTHGSGGGSGGAAQGVDPHAAGAYGGLRSGGPTFSSGGYSDGGYGDEEGAAAMYYAAPYPTYATYAPDALAPVEPGPTFEAPAGDVYTAGGAYGPSGGGAGAAGHHAMDIPGGHVAGGPEMQGSGPVTAMASHVTVGATGAPPSHASMYAAGQYASYHHQAPSSQPQAAPATTAYTLPYPKQGATAYMITGPGTAVPITTGPNGTYLSYPPPAPAAPTHGHGHAHGASDHADPYVSPYPIYETAVSMRPLDTPLHTPPPLPPPMSGSPGAAARLLSSGSVQESGSAGGLGLASVLGSAPGSASKPLPLHLPLSGLGSPAGPGSAGMLGHPAHHHPHTGHDEKRRSSDSDHHTHVLMQQQQAQAAHAAQVQVQGHPGQTQGGEHPSQQQQAYAAMYGGSAPGGSHMGYAQAPSSAAADPMGFQAAFDYHIPHQQQQQAQHPHAHQQQHHHHQPVYASSGHPQQQQQQYMAAPPAHAHGGQQAQQHGGNIMVAHYREGGALSHWSVESAPAPGSQHPGHGGYPSGSVMQVYGGSQPGGHSMQQPQQHPQQQQQHMHPALQQHTHLMGLGSPGDSPCGPDGELNPESMQDYYQKWKELTHALTKISKTGPPGGSAQATLDDAMAALSSLQPGGVTPTH